MPNYHQTLIIVEKENVDIAQILDQRKRSRKRKEKNNKLYKFSIYHIQDSNKSNEQMNSPQEYPKLSDFPSNSPVDLNCPPNQQINNYVLPPLIQSEGEKLIITFALIIFVFILFTSFS